MIVQFGYNLGGHRIKAEVVEIGRMGRMINSTPETTGTEGEGDLRVRMTGRTIFY